jgi:tetratricopeptide (TPR) repeat protein
LLAAAGAALLAASPALAQEGEASSPAYQAAARAYQAAERGDNAGALQNARSAASLAPGNRDYQILLFNLLGANGLTGEALVHGEAIARRFGPSPAFDVQRAGLLAQAERRAEARALLTAAIASRQLDAAEERTARITLADAAQADEDPAAALEALRPLAGEVSYDVQSRRGFALDALGQREEALAAFGSAFHLAVGPEPRGTMARAQIATLAALERQAEARALFDRSRESGLFNGSSPADLAYLANSVGDARTARSYFQQAEAAGSLESRMLLDAAYNARAVGERGAAVRYFEGALAAERSGAIRLEPQARLNVVNEIRETSRTVGGYVSVATSPTGAFAGATPGSRDATYAGGEIYWRPPVLNGQVELFGRAFMTLDQDEGATGAETTQGYVGVRVRPFTTVNVVLEASRLIPIGRFAQSDWLLRAGFGAGQGGGLRLDVPSWTEWSVFGEAAQFIESGQSLATLEGRIGRTVRLGGIRSHSALSGFLGARAAYDSFYGEPFSLGAGPGLSFRRGLGAGPYNAPWAILDLTLQYRLGLAGGEQAQGIYAGATLSY